MAVYPTGPYGFNVGNTISDFTFLGYQAGGGQFTDIDLSDYYDPSGTKGIKALFLSLGRSSCGACVAQAEDMNTWDTQYRSRGLRQLEALHIDIKPVDPRPGAPKDFTARQSTALDWIAKYASRYDVVIDSTYQLNKGVKPISDPRGWLIDAKTMKIVKTYNGASGFLQGLDALLK